MKKIIVIALLLLTACASGGSDETQLEKATFSDLRGWKKDQQAEAYAVFKNSCAVNLRRARPWQTRIGERVGDAAAWRRACAAVARFPNPTDDQARAFFESHFTPWRVTTGREPKGQMTGYYEPLLYGSTTRTGIYQTPVYGLPTGNRHFTREEIEAGALAGKAPVLLYVNDPVMLFSTQTQGSGKVLLTDGSMIGLQYAGQNGYDYVAIGKPMKEQGMIDTISLQTIHDWLRSHPGAPARAVMNMNPSYVYFKLSPGDEYAKGALGIPLTPLRSIAIDDDRAAYGVPTYIATTRAKQGSIFPKKLRRLFVSQDTGGALHGPHRADIFFGRGEAEEWSAGHQNTRGDVYWLLPI